MINSRPETLSKAIEMTMRLDEDCAQSHEVIKRRKSLATSPAKFKKIVVTMKNI